MSTIRHKLLAVSAATVSIVGLAACSESKDAAGAIAVTATDSKCDVATKEAKAGNVTFEVTNEGKKVTEFYVYADGDRIMGEVENIGAGLNRKLIVKLPAGEYETACKPGMKGDGIRGKFTVTGEAKDVDDPDLKAAAEDYEQYVKGQTAELTTKTQEFVDAVKAGKIDEAKALFPVARSYWERIEPVAEIFGDLDPAIDGREVDLAEGDEFTGFHRIEKALWVENDTSQMGPVADQLMADIQEIVKRIDETDLNALQLANGATALLDEIAAPDGKISGEEDIFSGTDLWDLAANLEGSKAAIESLRPVLQKRNPTLLSEIDERFVTAEATIAKHKVGDGYKFYKELTDEDKKDIVTAVNALKEKTSLAAGELDK
ncbi:MAG: iron uptake system protein EfeO [Corynebacteriales bacterium]|nr:iron uptake system protein EfeO [Mycobacteriales bacterium]